MLLTMLGGIVTDSTISLDKAVVTQYNSETSPHVSSPGRRRRIFWTQGTILFLTDLIFAVILGTIVALLFTTGGRTFWIALMSISLWVLLASPIRAGRPARSPRPPFTQLRRTLVRTLLVTLGALAFFPPRTVLPALLSTGLLSILLLGSRTLARRMIPENGVWIATSDDRPIRDIDCGLRWACVPIEANVTYHDLLALVTSAVIDNAARVVKIDRDVAITDADLSHLTWDLRNYRVSLQRPIYSDESIVPRRARTVNNTSSLDLEILSPRPALFTRGFKRTIDILGSVLLITILSPLFLSIFAIIKLGSRGPLLFLQERVGLDGRPFTILKFRSMVLNADAKLPELLAAADRENEPLFKIDHDPRVTAIGGIMRRYSLDELPQLFNVIGGSMSLVGPRPQRGSEVALYDDQSAQRLGVKPGMTGLWQVSGRSRLPWTTAVQLDRYYAHNWTVWMDLTILIRTVSAVVRGDGAQ